MRRAAATASAATVAAATAVLAQAAHLRASYTPLPDASGPCVGIARKPLLATRTLTAQQMQRGDPQPPKPSQSLPLRSRDAPTLELAAAFAPEPRPMSATPHASVAAAASPAEEPTNRVAQKLKNVLIVGDSLVTGVGCDPDDARGPALPRAIAEFMSKHFGADVHWASIGETGAGVARLRETTLPALAREVRRVQALGEQIDLVVVVVGLNDFKRAYTSSSFTQLAFRDELGALVDAIHKMAGKQCTVALPALPVHHAPVFGGVWPLQPCLAKIAAMWDEQKEAVAQRISSGLCDGRVCFVRNAAESRCLDWAHQRYWARDGIHPSDEGYRIWGSYIAEEIVRQLGIDLD